MNVVAAAVMNLVTTVIGVSMDVHYAVRKVVGR